MHKIIRRFLISTLGSFVIYMVFIKLIFDFTWGWAIIQALLFSLILAIFLFFQVFSRRMLITNILFHKYALEEIEQYDPVLKKEKNNYTVYKLAKKKWPFNRVSFRKTNFNLYIEAPFKIAERLEELNREKA